MTTQPRAVPSISRPREPSAGVFGALRGPWTALRVHNRHTVVLSRMAVRLRLVVLVLAAALGAGMMTDHQGAASAQASHSITQLAWLAGSWAGPDGALHHEEHWTAPRGGAMVGMHRTIKDDRMAEFEFIRIEEREGVLIYLSMPNGRSPATLFALRSLEGERVVFENAQHDFPQRIIYWKSGGDLRARIEGTTGGKTTSMEWTWKPSALAP